MGEEFNGLTKEQAAKLQELKKSMVPEKAVVKPAMEKTVATSEPAAIQPQDEWKKAKIIYYKRSHGYGFARLENGETVFFNRTRFPEGDRKEDLPKGETLYIQLNAKKSGKRCEAAAVRREMP